MSESIADALKYAVALANEQPSPKVYLEGFDAPVAVIRPCTAEFKSLESLLPNPPRFKRLEKFTDPDGFSEYVRGFKDDRLLLVGSLSARTVTAVIDYGNSDGPGWGDHKATLHLIETPDYKLWKEHEKKRLGQVAFAEFIQTVCHTVVDPESAALLDLAENLSITSNRTFDGRLNRTTGACQIGYMDDVQAGGPKQLVKVPDKVLACVQPYYALKPIDMLVYLRVRINDGQPVFFYELDRPWRFEEEAFNTVVVDVESRLERRVLRQP